MTSTATNHTASTVVYLKLTYKGFPAIDYRVHLMVLVGQAPTVSCKKF